MPLRTLAPKPGNPIINSGDFLAFLNEQGVNVAGDTVIAHADGSVDVDTLATTSLDEAWEAFEPPEPAPPAATRREQIVAAIEAATTLDELKAAIIEVAGPALVIAES